ncbi:MAG: PLP-dependent aminotransferase family protein [Ilumatobacteraceae bacterium]
MSETLLSLRARTARSSAVRDLLRLTELPHVLSLAGGLPAPELLPVAKIATVTAVILDTVGAAALQYGPTEGVRILRETVARRLGYGATAEHTIITTGSQQGLDLVARTLLDPGDVVVTELPTYLGALGALHWAGPQVVGVETDVDGMRTDQLEARLAAGLRPKMAYVVTDFANPTGGTMPAERRRHLAELADRYEFVIVEDSPYGMLRFTGETLPPVRRWSERTVTLGTASKILSPGLRVGWMTSPGWLHPSLVVAKQSSDLHTSTLNQRIIDALLNDEAWLDAHVAVLVRTYARRAELLLDSLDHHLGDSLQVQRPSGGMFVWGRLADPALTAERFLAAGIEQDVAFVPGSAFRPDGEPDGCLRMCFTTLADEQFDEAGARLARALASCAPAPVG